MGLIHCNGKITYLIIQVIIKSRSTFIVSKIENQFCIIFLCKYQYNKANNRLLPTDYCLNNFLWGSFVSEELVPQLRNN